MRARLVLLAAAAVLALGGCGARTPRVWSAASKVLPAEIDRVIYVDLDRLAQTRMGRLLLERAARREGVSCGLTRGEILWVTDREGHGAVFARLPDGDATALTRCGGERIAASTLPSAPNIHVLGVPDSVAVLTGGAGGLDRDDAFATGLVNVDFGAPLWVVARSRDKKMPGVMTMNVRVSRDVVEIEMRVPIGSRVKAWLAARMLEREMDKHKDRYDTFSAGADGGDVVIVASVSGEKLDRAMDELLR
jgi:hypothetical protein